VLNFAQLDAARLESIVESRFDHFMRPETPWETEGPYPDSVGNVLFTCGAYVHGGVIRILYGGGDSYVLAADVSKAELLAALA
jgi:beta-1,2-mannobiose phosphorylase / 1,2-beta-oligomannan phosphorylase